MTVQGRGFLTALMAAALAGAAGAQSAPSPALTFPAPATATVEEAEPLGSFRLPTGPYSDGTVPAQTVEGRVTRTAWRVAAPGLTTLQLLSPLRDQLRAAGYVVLFECETVACGGYDFRYGTDLLPEPQMHVDLGDFRWLSATRSTPEGTDHAGLMVSRTSTTGFVQLTRIGPPGAAPPSGTIPGVAASNVTAPGVLAPADTQLAPTALPAPEGLAAALDGGLAVPLEDLAFASGAADLLPGSYASLTALAGYLRTDPGRQVLLVGHTDASGGRDANVALSRARANSVQAFLIDGLGVPQGQVSAEGVGPLAPRASNLTEEGRTLNRRVEVMLTE